MKASQLREQSVEELGQVAEDLRKELSGLRIKKGVGDGSEQPLRIRTLRREVARVKTIIREREREKAKHG
jgi:large subunit ribosomal protein L29